MLGRLSLVALTVVASLAVTGPAFAKCDTVANAGDLQQARYFIDEACPCAAATSASAHGKCAKVVVNERVAGSSLSKSCRGEALNHAKKSICGRPGAAVCCRVKPLTGKTSHKIVKTVANCASSSSIAACVSVFPTIDTGCDATGCIEPVCGNFEVEPTEQCDVWWAGVCDANCQFVTCEPPTGTCGNGTVDAGEACEPPGAGACGWDCQATTCAPAAVGEIAVACVSGDAKVGVGSRGSDYLVAWTGIAHRDQKDVLVHRLDADGNALAVPRVASEGVPCTFRLDRPAVAGYGGRYVVGWDALGSDEYRSDALSIASRSYENDDALGVLAEISRTYPFGSCQTHLTGPLSLAPVPFRGPDAFAVLWRYYAGCDGGAYVNPDGRFDDYTGSSLVSTDLTIGLPWIGSPPPPVVPLNPAAIASNAADALFAMHAGTWTAGPFPSPTITDPIVVASWLAGDGSSTNFTLSTRQPVIGNLWPAVAAAPDRFLVAWAQGTGSDPTEIRAMRVTKLGGPLDADGGLLLGTAAGTVTGGPAAAFDGTVWLVVWAESAVGSDELRAVAVQTDGTIVDATPRLLASGLATGVSPAAASAGDDRTLVVYVKPDGAVSAVRAQLVPGT